MNDVRVSESAVLILGIGNLLLGDEGVGVHAVRRLERESLPPGVNVLDGGTGGFHLLSHLMEHRAVVVVDATMDGRRPGTVRRLRPRYPVDFPRTLVAHDVGLKDLLEAAQALGRAPPADLITVSVHPALESGMTLSPPVRAALPQVVATVREALDELGVPADQA